LVDEPSVAYGEAMAPETILVSEIPQRLTKRRESQWAAIIAHTKALLTNDLIRETHALVFSEADGVTDKTHSKVSQAIRTTAKDAGYRISVIWDRDSQKLYARSIGRRDDAQ
jgi:hypothetical protein